MTTRAHAEKDARILARALAAEARAEELEAEVERLRAAFAHCAWEGSCGVDRAALNVPPRATLGAENLVADLVAAIKEWRDAFAKASPHSSTRWMGAQLTLARAVDALDAYVQEADDGR